MDLALATGKALGLVTRPWLTATLRMEGWSSPDLGNKDTTELKGDNEGQGELLPWGTFPRLLGPCTGKPQWGVVGLGDPR